MKLSTQGIRLLKELKEENGKYVKEFEQEGFDQATVNRALLELEEKGLIDIKEKTDEIKTVTEKGEEVIKKGSPEYRLIEQLETEKKPISELKGNTNIGIGKAKQRGWIEIEKGDVMLTEKGKKISQDPVKNDLEKEKFNNELEERGLVSSKIKKSKALYLNQKGKKIDLDEIEEDFNVEARTETPRIGKEHFYNSTKCFIRQNLIEMGFKEIKKERFVSNHNFLEIEDKISSGEITETLSRRLNSLQKGDIPAKYFVISRSLEKESDPDPQEKEEAEAIIIGKKIGYSHLKDYLSELLEKLEYNEVRLIPKYSSYMTLSTEIQIRNGEQEKWIKIGVAGLFRPERAESMLEFEANIITWSIDISRAAIEPIENPEIQNIFSKDIENLQKMPIRRY